MESAFSHVESRINTTDYPVFCILLYPASSVCLLLYSIPSLPFLSYYASYCYPLFSVLFVSPFVLISCQPFLFISHVFFLFVHVIVSQFFLFCPSFAMSRPCIICLGRKQRGRKYFGNVQLVISPNKGSQNSPQAN
jgi:hypothetical protein